MDNNTTIQELKEKIEQFVKERDWSQFHNSKNLSISIAIEAAELMEHFQWKNEIENKAEIENEIADITAYILSFCIINNIDLSKAIENKLEINRKKYPLEKCKGKSDKYNKYD